MLVGLAAVLSFVGCAEEAPPPPPPAPVEAPAPPPPPAPVEPVEMAVDALAAAHDANAGKPVKVKAFYGSMTKQENPAQINVDLNSSAELTGAKAVCVFDVAKEADLAALVQKSEVTVTGTLSAEKMGDAEKIDACELVPAPMGEGKMGKGAKAAEGEGGAEGKAGKGGKAKAH